MSEAKRQRMKGQSLIEVIIALALVAMAVPAVFTAISAMSKSTVCLSDHSVRLELTQSQLEYIQAQEYQHDAQDYRLIEFPQGYTVALKSSIVATYKYPDGKKAPGEVQQISITVTGRHGTTELQGYKAE